MSVDAERAALVLKEYRYANREDTSVKARFALANDVEIDTTLSATDADALAQVLLNNTKTYPVVFEVMVEGLLYPEDFIGGFPRFVVDFGASHPAATAGATFTVIKAKPNYEKGTTLLAVRK